MSQQSILAGGLLRISKECFPEGFSVPSGVFESGGLASGHFPVVLESRPCQTLSSEQLQSVPLCFVQSHLIHFKFALYRSRLRCPHFLFCSLLSTCSLTKSGEE